MKVVAALDLSKGAEMVLEKAVDMAKGGELTLLTVAESFLDIGDVFPQANMAESMLAKSKELMAGYQAKAKALGVQAKGVVESGVSPADIIIKFAEDNKADLLVMGSRAKKGLDRFLIGSVASKVVAGAPCSVFVIR